MTAVGDVVPPTGDATRASDAPRPCDLAAEVISDRAEGEAYVASVCFKHGPPRRVGVELEYTVHYREDPRRHLDPDDLAAALGPHTPRSLRPDSPALRLPSGSPLTLEPGGQVEISTLPQDGLRELVAAATADLHYVTELLSHRGLILGCGGTDIFRDPVRILPTDRYSAMERRFNRMGPDGLTMMCATAGLQVCLDTGERDQLPARWAALHAVGPVLVALFATSSRLAGVDTGLASARWRAVMRTEPARTAPTAAAPDPVAAWAARVMDTPLLVVRNARGSWDAPPKLSFGEWIEGSGDGATLRRPTFGDLDYHLTTFFTPVRPRGYLEVRYLDAQAGDDWISPVALLLGLLSDERTAGDAFGICAPIATEWHTAVHRGLADDRLAHAAAALVKLGCSALPALDLDEATTARVAESLHRRIHRKEVA